MKNGEQLRIIIMKNREHSMTNWRLTKAKWKTGIRDPEANCAING